MMDDDDDLYGPSAAPEQKPKTPTAAQPVPISNNGIPSNGIVAKLEEEAQKDDDLYGEGNAEEGDGVEEESAGADEESDDDVEIIMETQSRSLDFRQQNRPPAARTNSASTTNKPPAPSLTTEYKPLARGVPAKEAQPQSSPAPSSQSAIPPPSTSTPSAPIPQELQSQPNGSVVDDGPDPSTLPPATAPPSHPAINPDMPGVMDGRSILDVDLAALADKPWRRPGSDISDWFNYGFDEISWEAYCYRRRDLGELGSILKQNVLNFAAMPEDQLTALPPELRQMVMTGATTLMNNGGPNAMMGGMNPMMDMSMMGGMGGMGMNGDMGMQMQPGGPMMDANQMGGMMSDGAQGQAQANGGAEQNGNVGGPMAGQMMGNEGFAGGGPGQMMMGGDFGGMQDQSQMYQNMEAQPNVQPVQQPIIPQGGRGGGFPYRARGQQPRGRGYVPRGRGRGIYSGEGPPAPVRPASPLPPGVPTGPRNQNKYKDRDGNAPAVDGLDYGGTAKEGGYRTPSGEPEDRSSRKRRVSPGLDDGRGSKRR